MTVVRQVLRGVQLEQVYHRCARREIDQRGIFWRIVKGLGRGPVWRCVVGTDTKMGS